MAGLTALGDINPNLIFDPGAGAGAWGTVARSIWPKSTIVGYELRKVQKPIAYNYWYTGDFLLESEHNIFDLVIGNPPYSYAEQFVKAGYQLLDDGGYMVYLLRMGFLEGQTRLRRLYRKYAPKKVVVCSNRPSFIESGQTTSEAFGYFVWQKGYTGPTMLEWTLVKV